MRKVDSDMIAAIRARRPFNKGNRRVEYTTGLARVYFHGNHIFSIDDRNEAMINNQGYQTATTKSILNCLIMMLTDCHGLYQRAFQWFIVDKGGKDHEYNGGWMMLP